MAFSRSSDKSLQTSYWFDDKPSIEQIASHSKDSDSSGWIRINKHGPANCRCIPAAHPICYRPARARPVTEWRRRRRAGRTGRCDPDRGVAVRSNATWTWAKSPVGSRAVPAPAVWSAFRNWPEGIPETCRWGRTPPTPTTWSLLPAVCLHFNNKIKSQTINRCDICLPSINRSQISSTSMRIWIYLLIRNVLLFSSKSTPLLNFLQLNQSIDFLGLINWKNQFYIS